MKKFRQTETLGCFVTWIKEIEAENEEEAMEAFDMGEGTLISETIGDCIDGYDECEIEEVNS